MRREDSLVRQELPGASETNHKLRFGQRVVDKRVEILSLYAIAAENTFAFFVSRREFITHSVYAQQYV